MPGLTHCETANVLWGGARREYEVSGRGRGLSTKSSVDLYAGAPQTPASTAVYYDDMSLAVPEPATLALLGLLGLLRRR